MIFADVDRCDLVFGEREFYCSVHLVQVADVGAGVLVADALVMV